MDVNYLNKGDKKRFPRFSGSCEIQSNLELEELASKISFKLFGNLEFIYGEHSIWEEIPSMYIDSNILGMLVIFGGYGKEDGYCLEVSPYGEYDRYVYNNQLRDYEIWMFLYYYLYYLLKQAFENDLEVQIVEPKMNRNSHIKEM